jgi:exosortase
MERLLHAECGSDILRANSLSMAYAGEETAGKMPSNMTLRRDWWQWAVIVVLIAVLYFPILARLAHQWRTDDNYSHGFFVPAFSAYVIWHERRRLAALEPRPCWWGALLVSFALVVLICGVFGAELFLSRSSLVLLLGSLVVYSFGWKHFRALLFPWAFLFLMIPIPAIVFNQIAFPLQLVASTLASSLLSAFGVPVLREGNVIQLPAMSLEVVEACSGIRSLMSLCTLAVIYGYFLEPRIRSRVALALAAVPIAVAANSLRIVGTGLLGQYWDPDKAQGFFHIFSGWLIFVMSLLMLFGLHGLFRLGERWRSRGKERGAA